MNLLYSYSHVVISNPWPNYYVTEATENSDRSLPIYNLSSPVSIDLSSVMFKFYYQNESGHDISNLSIKRKMVNNEKEGHQHC